MPDMPSRHRPHHEIIPATDRPTLVFLTVCVRDRKRVLASPAVHDAIDSARTSATAWRVGRYVIMPDHLHLFATPARRSCRWSVGGSS